MNENDLYEVLASFKGAIEALETRINNAEAVCNAVVDRLQKTENMLFEDILNPAKAALEQSYKDERFDDFNSKYGEKLSAFNGPLQSIEGDENFDLAHTAFDEYDALEDKPDSDAWVDELINKVSTQIESIKEAVNAPADADIVVEKDGETGETEIKVDGEDIAEPEAAPEEVPEAEEVPAEEEPAQPEEEEEDEVVDDEEVKSDPDELAQLYKDAEAAVAKSRKK